MVVVASVMGVGSIMDGGLVEAGGPMVRVGGLMVFLVAVDTENSSFFFLSVYIKRIQKVSYYFFHIKNISKLINLQLKSGVKK